MIAIKEMEMPRWCGECPMCKEERIGDDVSTYCALLNQDITWNGNRVDNCPLVEIVTCKDCKYTRQNDDNERYCDLSGRYYDPDYFCANAERRE